MRDKLLLEAFIAYHRACRDFRIIGAYTFIYEKIAWMNRYIHYRSLE
jgi:hypothetical protein